MIVDGRDSYDLPMIHPSLGFLLVKDVFTVNFIHPAYYSYNNSASKNRMGRTEPSVGRPPAAFRKDARAKKAKATINQLIPSLLVTHPRARSGINAAELIVDPPRSANTQPRISRGQSAGATEQSDRAPGQIAVSLEVADTLTVARRLLNQKAAQETDVLDLSNKSSRVAVLNMASPLSPGGGFLNGATSQEESLCMRTTLLPSLKDEYYRLPEIGAIYTPDVLVFREADSDDVLSPKERWFVDCISAAMLRGPETDLDDLGRGSYTNDKDREQVIRKMRTVMRICCDKGVKKLVLGAWGCGANGNPVGEIAKAWRKVLMPGTGTSHPQKRKAKKNEESWEGIKEIVFAIKEPGLADAFAVAFGDGIVRINDKDEEVEEGESDEDNGNEGDGQDKESNELLAQIQQLELRVEATHSPQLKTQLSSVLDGLRSRLKDE
ncbi:unnamed protein product [Clonostachys chloroleuca]|uniref:Microbial-type PARG catalytic domain-containing protein n=1 Tax=Clonostachys chloroleuca TaxID=1926264 RepID=A0AA35MCR1_9HYPO|nr:unnamed protein product [Clonostachys chloroleuca]